MRRLLIALGGVIAAFFLGAPAHAAEFIRYDTWTYPNPSLADVVEPVLAACSGTWFEGEAALLQCFPDPISYTSDAGNAEELTAHRFVSGSVVRSTRYRNGLNVGETSWANLNLQTMTCPAGESPGPDGQCRPDSGACEATKGKSEFVRITGEQMTPVRIGIEGCAYELLLPGFCMATVGGNSNDVCGGVYFGTGEEYQGGALPGGSTPEPLPPNQDQICATGEHGNTVCIDRPDDNDQQCGTINGQPVCIDKLPDEPGQCEWQNGNWYCGGGQSDVPKPPDPDAPVDDEGNPAQGDTINITNNDTVNNNIENSQTTVGRGSPYGSGGEDPGEGDPGEGEPGTNVVKIDESGTPESADPYKDVIEDSGIDSLLEQLGEIDEDGNGQVSMPTPEFGQREMPLPDFNADCRTLTLDIVGKGTLTLPGERGCTNFGKIKELLRWLFYLLTALMLYSIATQPVRT